MNVFQAVQNLGKRVVLTARIGSFPKGRSGQLISVQSGVGPDGVYGEPHLTVSFDLNDYWEENVPLWAVRPLLPHG